MQKTKTKIMKKLYFLFFVMFFVKGTSQFNPNAPWMQNDQKGGKASQVKFDQIVKSFNEYWKGKDITRKGAGYKPFKRWENYWQNLVKPDGTLMTAYDLQMAWNEKQASKQNLKKMKLSLPVSNWQPIGPLANATTINSNKTMARGRVNIVAVDPNNSNTIYFGTPAGGIWKSINGGVTWTALTDELAQIGVSGIAIDPSNSNIIYIATGDKDAGDTYSIGVLKSTDGGATWNTTGLSFTGSSNYLGDILVNPSNSQIVICASSNGLYRSTNGGVNWTQIQSGNNFSQGSIRFKPNSPSTVYAVSKNKFFKSTDSGATFNNIAITGITDTGADASGRLLLDVTPANANYVYILSSKGDTGDEKRYSFNGIFRSTNSGSSFTKSSQATSPTNVLQSDQAWYDLAFAASPTALNELYVGCLNVWKTTDAGATNANWTMLNDWRAYNQAFTHADIHHLQFFNNKLYCGSDGGIYVSNDKGVNFTDITGEAQITQFYKIDVAKQSAANIVGGTQDNGGYAYSNSTWKGYHGGDGMDCAVNPLDSKMYYGFIYYGRSLYISSNAGESLSGAVAAPELETGLNDDGDGDEGGNWVTPLVMNKEGELFSGFKRLYRLNGNEWIQQSSSTIGNGDVEFIAIDPSNSNNMFVSNGVSLYKSTDKGVTFSNVYSATSSITSVSVNSNNSNIIYITTAGTTGQVLKSTNGGTIFTSISTGLPAVGKNIIKHQAKHSKNPLYLGTTIGVYYMDDEMSQWLPFDTNLPNAPVRDLEINLNDSKLIAGTYGRGAWITDVPYEAPASELRLMSIQNIPTKILCGEGVTPQIIVKNIGSTNINSVNIDYVYGATNSSTTWNGTITPNSVQNIDLPVLNPTTGAYKLTITSTTSGDAYSDNNTDFSIFYANDSNVVGAPVKTFETAADELLTYNEGEAISLWKRGVNTNGILNSGATNNVYTTNFTGDYPNSTKSYLVSECYDFTYAVNPMIKFKLGFDLEPNWDVIYVEYSTNFGQTWTVLGTQGANWYNSNRTQATAGNDCYNCPGAQWTGTAGTLTEYFYTLNSLMGQPNVIFRVVFHSDEALGQLGAVLDDFVIEGLLSNDNFELNNVVIYPNPSKDVFTISLGDIKIDSLEVYDLTGKKINSAESINNNSYKLDLNNVSNGVYFIKLTSGKQQTVKRIIKN